MPRGWEDYWGRVRRVQYPTVIDAKKEVTAYRSDASWYTHRTYEADLEFNLQVPYLQVHVVWTMQIHAKATTTVTSYYRGRTQAYWNDTLFATGPTMSGDIPSGISPCLTEITRQDAKYDVVLDKKYWRGRIRVEFQLYVSNTAETELRITDDICKAEVAPYQW